MSDSQNLNQRLAALPKIDELFDWAPARALVATEPRSKMLEAFRIAVTNVRARWRAGDTTPFSLEDVELAIASLSTPRLRPVLNATGVVLHTNLGRAPLATRAVERLAATAGGYLNLEFDLDEGERGDRSDSVRHHLTALTGAQDALVVNNCAGAVLLALSAVAKGREAVVSRGELVEIGGAFRIPEVMEASGAKLKEVGTTNRTRASDYAGAISEYTGALLKVHRSNFAIVGFTEEASVKELAAVARAKNIPLMVDLGSGALASLSVEGGTQEPTVRDHVAAGAHVVMFSGDKLLGGPQAGILVGDAALIERIRKHPLARAVRADKLTLLALEATLELYRTGLDAEIPVRAMMQQTPEQLRRRAEKLQLLLGQAAVRAELVEVESRVGGGAMPLAGLSSWAVAVIPKDADGFCQRLRTGEPAVAARLRDGVVYFDVRCLADAALESLSSAVAAASNEGGP